MKAQMTACPEKTPSPLHIFMGGTFDPVHVGHLRIALDVCDAFDAATVSLMPCYQPVHREAPVASAADRLAMLTLAIAGCPQLAVDDLELVRAGPSYTVDTLAELRARLGADAPIAIVIGADAFAGFTTWKAWQQIPGLAHIIVVSRPGYQIAASPPDMSARPVDDPALLQGSAAGGLLRLSLTMLDVSSTEIRQRLMQGKSVKCLLPDPVIHYIESRGLYRAV
jgi:nicotinate-nucleotide adenylyltransferase